MRSKNDDQIMHIALVKNRQIETFLTIDKWADVQFAIFRLFALCFAPLVHSPWPNTVESVDREEEELVFCTPLVPMND